MDEQGNNKQEKSEENGVADAAQKTSEAVKDTAQAVKDGANLAKDISTGNVLGIVKDAVNLLKNKQVRKMLLFSILASVTGIILLASSLFAIFNAVGDGIQNIATEMTNWYQKNYMYGVIFYSEEQIDKIIAAIENMGIDLNDLHLMGDVDYSDPDIQEKEKQALRKYIVKFLVAQEKMQTLNPKPGGENGIEGLDNWLTNINLNNAITALGASTGQTLTWGQVYVHRDGYGTLVDKNMQTAVNNMSDGQLIPHDYNQLGYLAYDEMKKLIEAKDDKAFNYFSVDENGNLVYPKKTKTTIEKKKNGRKVNDESSETITYELESIDYKSVISQYTTSLQFFVYLTMITQNPEFASAVADLAANGEIRIMIMDNTTTNTEKETYTYTKHTKTRQEATEVGASEAEEVEEVEEVEEYEDNYDESSETEYIDDKTEITVTEETVTKTEVINPKVAIVYANTWFCEQRIIYQKVENDETTSTNVLEINDEEEPPDLTEVGEESWRTNQTITIEMTNKSVEYEESIHGEVIDKTGEKGDGDNSFIGLLDKEFKIPNTNRKSAAGSNLVSGADWFFELLKIDSQSQNLEQVMRYILYKYTNKDYGVTELDFGIFDAKNFNSTVKSSNRQLTEYIHYFEGTKTNEDGTKYIVFDDGAGNPTVGYGINLTVESYKNLLEQAGYSTEIGSEVDIDFVDAIEQDIISKITTQVKSIVSELDLTDYQINALVSRAYNCGVNGALKVTRGSGAANALNFVDSYKKYWNSDTDNLYKQNISTADFSHSLYTEYMSKPVTSNGQHMEGLEKRRKSEWTLFQTGYYDVLNEWSASGGDILKAADKIHRDQMTWTYSVSGDLTLYDIEGSLTNQNKVTCCATYVADVIYVAGYETETEMNSFNYNSSNALYAHFKQKGWQEITSYDRLQPGDIVFMSTDSSGVSIGHVQIYAGDDTWYNAGDTKYIQAEAPQNQGSYARNHFITALRPSL